MAGTVRDVRPGEGLRERHLRWTAAALEEVALRLFSERGFDAVTVDEIAGEAGVSRRTFFRYYASKEDVLFSDDPRWLVELRQAVAARPAEEPALTALRRAFLFLTADYEVERERLLRRARIVAASPALQGGALGRQRVWEEAVTEMVAQRLGVDPAVDLRPGLVAATTLAAMRVAVETWLAGGGRAHLSALVAETLDLLDDGRLQQLGGTRPEGFDVHVEATIRAISERHRREIVHLVEDDELTVSQIAAHFDVTRPAISQHLRILKDAGLLTERRQGQRRWYRARPQGLAELRQFLDALLEDDTRTSLRPARAPPTGTTRLPEDAKR